MIVTKWKKDAKEFEMKLSKDGSGSIICRVPKPVFEMLGNPKSIRFEILGKKILVGATKVKQQTKKNSHDGDRM